MANIHLRWLSGVQDNATPEFEPTNLEFTSSRHRTNLDIPPSARRWYTFLGGTVVTFWRIFAMIWVLEVPFLLGFDCLMWKLSPDYLIKDLPFPRIFPEAMRGARVLDWWAIQIGVLLPPISVLLATAVTTGRPQTMKSVISSIMWMWIARLAITLIGFAVASEVLATNLSEQSPEHAKTLAMRWALTLDMGQVLLSFLVGSGIIYRFRRCD